ncbi:MAG: hypothetical protein COV76_05900 [Candidatus Omnitrophica bacterium CG11_big_fil_rev_8_21_14_0_20_64_10]|nr:MAG: hypothetical protein COV76_05900 [Candidatus Omnitrophica bacterium CG11_big_fil_rev_8_21_14_0_20_64_10]
MRWIKRFFVLGILGAVVAAGVVWGPSRIGRLREGGVFVGQAKQVVQRYQCPMHPQVIQDHPGNCPICGMALAAMGSPAVQQESEPSAPEGGLPGRAVVTLSPDKQQRIGVRTARVERRDLERRLFTAGRIAHDPALYQAQAEYLSAQEAMEAARAGGSPGASTRSEALVEAARLRLRLLGMGDDEIAWLEGERTPERSLLLPPERQTVWMYADIYEQDLPETAAGQRVEASLPGQPGKRFEGEITAVEPTVDPATRSARARVRLDNAEGLLRPGMYLNAVVRLSLGQRLAVPREAVLDTGVRQIVFVREGEGRFEPRSVRLGPVAGGWQEVLEGLREGETVVTSGNFLLDAESQLKGAAGSAFYGGHQHSEESEPSQGEHRHD